MWTSDRFREQRIDGPRAGAPLTVDTVHGPVRGTVANGVRTWRGIPYAAPPVGPLRFRAPRPPASWSRLRDASRFGDSPPQVVRSRYLGAGRRPVSEDCLTINVSAPLDPPARPLPVVVCIYGGGFLIGSSASPLYRGDRIVANGDVVFVSLNYRLGALGFLDVTRYADAAYPFESNLGLRDQVAGLEWVRRNIAAFGGDPGNVTLLGQSAGGTSVLALMASPAASGLFHRGFVLSPAPASVYGRERHAGWAEKFVRALGADERDAARALATLPWGALVGAMDRLAPWLGQAADRDPMPTSPVVDGEFLPSRPIDAFQSAAVHPVPLVVGTAAREAALFRYLNALPTSPSRIEGAIAGPEPHALERILAAYPRFPRRSAVIDMVGDGIFWHPAVQVTEAHARLAPTWSYRFDFETPLLRLAGLGATHGTDMPSLFGNYDDDVGRLYTLLGRREEAEALSRRFQGALVSFAHTGDPGAFDGEGVGWPRYDEAGRQVRIFDVEDRIESDPRRELRVAWAGYRGFL